MPPTPPVALMHAQHVPKVLDRRLSESGSVGGTWVSVKEDVASTR